MKDNYLSAQHAREQALCLSPAACRRNAWRIAAVLMATILLPSATFGQARAEDPLREVVSGNERFRFEIRAGHPGHSKCRGALFERIDQRWRGRRLWHQRLVNEVAPESAVISNDGRFVVTLGEFRRGGATHALVIYDEQGKLLREFDLRELLLPSDWQHVHLRDKAINWLTGAELEFVETPPQFLIKLRGERELRIDLTDLCVVGRKDAKPGEFATPDAKIPPELLALLVEATNAAASQPTARPATTQPVTIPPASNNPDDPVVRFIVEASAITEVTDLQVKELETLVIPAEPSPYAGNSDMTDRPVPAPNPGNPVDYVSWYEEQIAVDGPSAVPLYESAIENFQPWEGDPNLFDAAMDGDLAALASPEIAAWIESNEVAIENYRVATKLEFQGWPTNLEKDSYLRDILLPNLSQIRALSRVTLLKGQQLAIAGDYDGAMEHYVDVLKAGVHASNGPTVIENLVGIAIQAMTSGRILTLLETVDDDAVDYADLAEQLDQHISPLRPIEEAMQYERAQTLQLAQACFVVNPDTGDYDVRWNASGKLLTGNDSPPSIQSSAELFLFLQGYEDLVAATNIHYDKLTQAAQVPHPECRSILNSIKEPQTMIPRLLLPSLGRAVQLRTQLDTDRRATRLIAHLKAHRQEHGEYPTDLSVFADENYIIDPFGDAPFQYRREGDDFVLYSVGLNATNEGGTHDRRRWKNDYVFWPPPANEED